MRAQLPIIIASFIVAAIILSSIYFITSMNIRSSIRSVSYDVLFWLRMDHELDNLAYIMLREGSQVADHVFNETYYEYLQNANSLSDLYNAVIIARSAADKAMDKRTMEIRNNWTLLKEREGFTVEFIDFNSTYFVGFGYGFSNVYFKVRIVNINGDMRVFTKNYTVYLGLTLSTTNINLINEIISFLGQWLGFLPEINLTAVFTATAYLDMNGQKYYYVIDRRTGELIAENTIRLLQWLFGERDLRYKPQALFYYKNGKTEIVYKIDATGGAIAILAAIYGQTDLGATTSISIDGFYARSAIRIR